MRRMVFFINSFCATTVPVTLQVWWGNSTKKPVLKSKRKTNVESADSPLQRHRHRRTHSKKKIIIKDRSGLFLPLRSSLMQLRRRQWSTKVRLPIRWTKTQTTTLNCYHRLCLWRRLVANLLKNLHLDCNLCELEWATSLVQLSYPLLLTMKTCIGWLIWWILTSECL